MNRQIALLERESQSLADVWEMDTATLHGETSVLGRLRPAAADKLLENTLIFSIDSPVALTRRERDILRLIVAGQTNKQIGRRLSRSERTVEYHRNRLMRKMGVHNAAELVRCALVMGVI